jgi:hypothetical protein
VSKTIETAYTYNEQYLGYTIEEEKNGYTINLDSTPMLLMYPPTIPVGINLEEHALNYVRYISELDGLNFYNVTTFNRYHLLITECILILKQSLEMLRENSIPSELKLELDTFLGELEYYEFMEGKRYVSGTSTAEELKIMCLLVTDELKPRIYAKAIAESKLSELKMRLGSIFESEMKAYVNAYENYRNADAIKSDESLNEEERTAALMEIEQAKNRTIKAINEYLADGHKIEEES